MRRLSLALFLAAATLGSAQDYPGAVWVPAHSSNYTVSSRPSTYPVRYVVIHVTQGSYAGAISWFQNPSSNVSAHYVLRSSDGQVTQMVQEKDVAWHAGNWTYNTQSVGLEHEGFVSNPAWFTTSMYRSSADVTRHLARKWAIPRTRTFVIGHNEVPGATHTDPGQYWNWNYYMSLVRLDAEYVGVAVPDLLLPGTTYKGSVFLRNTGDDEWESYGPDAVVLGTQNPQDRASAFYSPGDWLSPSRIGPARYATPPGGIAEFKFGLTVPTAYGTYVESFKPVIEGLTWFGPTVTFTLSVWPGEVVIDNVSSNFSVVGTWFTGTTAPGRYGSDYRWANASPKSNDVASWYLDAPTAGQYDVYAWWSQGSNRSTAATYTVEHSKGTATYVANQQANGGQWNLVGRYRLGQGGGFVRLRATGNSGVAIADAVRIVGPF